MVCNDIYITPFFDNNYVAISAASSNEYAGVLSVWLQSIKNHSSPNYNYDIVILEDDISDDNKEILKSFFETKPNLSLRFFNPSILYEGLNMKVTYKYVNKVSFYRVGCPIYFKRYDRLITTDLDLIFNEDPAKLYYLDMHNSLILSVLEPIWSRWVNCHVKKNGILVTDYGRNRLNLKDLHRYYNTGVALLDINRINLLKLAETCLEKMKSDTPYIFLDQDILNEVYRDYFGVLPYKWNYAVIENIYIETADSFFRDYCSVNEPCIIHFLSENKPWKSTKGRLAFKWWNLARESPYYEYFLQNLCRKDGESLSKSIYSRIANVITYSKNRRKVLFYSILLWFVYGEKRKKIIERKNKAYTKILMVKELIK